MYSERRCYHRSTALLRAVLQLLTPSAHFHAYHGPSLPIHHLFLETFVHYPESRRPQTVCVTLFPYIYMCEGTLVFRCSSALLGMWTVKKLPMTQKLEK